MLVLHEHASAKALGLGRICVYGLWLLLVAATPIQWHADVPYELFEPWGPLRLLSLPDDVYQTLLTPAFLFAFKTVLIALLVLLVLGIRPFAPISLLVLAMLLVHDGLIKVWQGSPNHAEGVLLYAAMILPLFPAADGMAVPSRSHSRARARRDTPTALYASGLQFIALVLCFTYSLVGIRRLAYGGVEVFTGDALLASLALRSLEYGPFGFQYGLLPLTVPWLAATAKVAFAVLTVFEILAPFALISRGFRYAWLVVIVSFHFVTLFTMNIFFWENLVLIVAFVTGTTHALALARGLDVGLSRFRGRLIACEGDQGCGHPFR